MRAVYAEGEQAQGGPFAVARTVVRRLAESEPTWPELSPAGGSIPAPPVVPQRGEAIAQEEWPALVDALSEWLIAFAGRVPLALGIDDVDASDEPSLAVLANVAEAASSRQLVVLISTDPGSKRGAVERLRAAGSSHVLRPLRAQETRQLVSAVFGDVPHVDGVAEWVHRLADGSPRTSLELAQHLVDRRLARYGQGSWVLPASLEGLSLPESVQQAQGAKIAGLGPLARELAEGLALTTDDEPLRLEEFAALLDDKEHVFDALNELVAASILVGQGATYVFANKSIKQGLERAISAERRRALYRRLANAYGESSSVLAAYYLFLAGEQQRSFSVLVGFIANRTENVFRGLSFVRSDAGARFYEQAFEWGMANGAAPGEVLLLGRALLGLAATVDTRLARHAPAILNQLERDVGLVYWEEFESITDPLERIRSCIGRAFAVREATPEGQRGLDPVKAIQEFAACTAMLAGVYARVLDPEGVSALLPNMNRLRPLSPAVDILTDMVDYTGRALRGWEATELRLRVIERLAEPLPGLEEAYRGPIRMTTIYYQALAEAATGHETVFERIEVLEGHTPYAPLVWQVRTVAHLFKGAEKQAEACRRKRDLSLVGRLDVDRQLETSLAHEVNAYMLLADLMALKRTMPVLEERARKWPGWKPYCLLAQGTYQGLRGDLRSALELCRQAVALVKPAENAGWFAGMNRVLRLMLQLGLPEEARDLGRSALTACAKQPASPYHVYLLEMALAVAEARTGERLAAKQRGETVLQEAEKRGTNGIVLIELLAGYAQVAQELNDDVAFAAVSKKIGEMCTKVDSSAFATKLSSLLRLPLGAGFEPVDASPSTINTRGAPGQIDARIRTEIDLCRGAEERAKRALSTVLRYAGASQGFLYLNQPEGPTLVASRSNDPPPTEMDEYLFKCLRSPEGAAGDQTETTGTGSGGPFGNRFVFLPLSTHRADDPVTAAIAMIDCQGTRPRIVPEMILSALAEALIDAGDVVRE